MRSQRDCVRKLLVANPTLVRLYAGVDTLVHFEIAEPVERFITH